jgi:hypothetical protein
VSADSIKTDRTYFVVDAATMHSFTLAVKGREDYARTGLDVEIDAEFASIGNRSTAIPGGSRATLP